MIALLFMTANFLPVHDQHTLHTFICVAQPMAFQGEFRFELFTTQIAEMMTLRVVSVHVSLQVAPIAT